MQIAIIGSGYVGLVSGACFADFGHSVVCVDLDPARVDALQAGRIPFFEPGLKAVRAGFAYVGTGRGAVEAQACGALVGDRS